MRKDELQSTDYCAECVDAEASAETEDNGADDCCCCCCSCSDNTSDGESNDASVEARENRVMPTLKQQKEDLLSKLTILRTHKEPTSVQQILQFVEALAHSTDFLRRYNMQEDFCLECVLSEPTCTCCVNEMSQLNVNGQHHDSCDECNANETPNTRTHTSRERAECTASTKEPNSGLQTNRNRRERRQRRRQRNIRHALPRVTAALPSNHVSTSRISQHQNPGSRNNFDESREPRTDSQHVTHPGPLERGRNRRESLNHDDSCEECPRVSPRISQRESHRNPGNDNCDERCQVPPRYSQRGRNRNRGETLVHDDNCEECVREATSRRGSRSSLRNPEEAHGNSHEDTESCEECARENLPSTSCTFPGCEDCESKTYRLGIRRGNVATNRKRNPECNQSSVNKSKQSTSAKPECDQGETCHDCTSRNRDDASECSCDDCHSSTECSDQSCDECRFNSSRKNKKK